MVFVCKQREADLPSSSRYDGRIQERMYLLKQRLLILLLSAVLLATAPGCRKKSPQTDGETTQGAITLPSDTVGGPSDTQSNTPSAPPPPEQELVSSTMTELLFNEKAYFPEGQADKSLTDLQYTLTMPEGTQAVSLTLVGWAGYNLAVDSFGYSLNGEDPVYGNFSVPADEKIPAEGGAYATGYRITAPLFELSTGTHTVTFVARLADGSVVEVYHPITLVLEGLIPQTDIPYHAALTHVNGKGPGIANAYSNRTGSLTDGAITVNAPADGVVAADDGTLRISGWLALDGGVDHYAWSADGLTWHAITENGISGEPSDGHFSGLGHENAADHALLQDLTLDLSVKGGQTFSLMLGGVPNDNTEGVVPFLTIQDVFVPNQPTDIPYSHTVEAKDNAIGTDFVTSTLAELFSMRYGAGDTHAVLDVDGAPCFAYEGIHSIQNPTEGKYAMTVSVEAMTGCSFFFVRGTQMVNSVVSVPLSLDNYFETDGTHLCGGAGIYVQLSENTLTVVIKGLDPSADYRIRNYTYEFKVSGKQLTLADDGRTVYVLVDGKEITRITMHGAQSYPEHFRRIQPSIQFAATATIALQDGSTATVNDTLVASSCIAECGAAIRGGAVYFTRVEMIPFSEAGI